MPSEATPLLSEPERPSRQNAGWPAGTYRSRLSEHWKTWSTVYLCGLFIFIVDFPAFMRVTPKLRMFELGVCREYYSRASPSVIGPDGDIPEELCKLDEIQSQLAKLRGILGLLQGIPGLLLAVPYGILADRRGRRLVAGLGLVGQVLGDSWILFTLSLFDVFPTRATYAAALFQCIGGGSSVLSAVVIAMIADVAPSSSRTRIFFYMGIIMLVSEMISPPLGSFLMDTWGPSFAYLFGLPLECFGFLVLIIIPETAMLNKADDAGSSRERCLGDASPLLAEESPKPFSQRVSFSAVKAYVKQDITPLLSRNAILLGLVALFVNKFSRPLFEVLIQYMSARFGWKLAKTAYIVSIQAMVHIAVLCTILPWAHDWLLKRSDKPRDADLSLSRGSIVFLFLGSLGMGFAPHWMGIVFAIVVFTLGGGFAQAVRSFLTSLVPREHIGLLYTMIAVADGVGALIAPPVLGVALSVGLKAGNILTGLPFFIAAALYLACGLSIWSISKHVRSSSDPDGSSNDQNSRAD